MDNNILNICENCAFISGAAKALSKADLKLLSRNVVSCTFKKGEILIKQGMLVSNIFYIKKGIVKVHIQGQFNNERIIKIAYSSCFLGLPSIFGNRINHFSATALSDTSACIIDLNFFRNLTKRNGAFAYELISGICKDELSFYYLFITQSEKHLNGRFADSILFFSNEVFHAKQFELPLNRDELGNYIGTSREGVTRTMTKFKEEGIIDVDYKTVTVLKPKKLQQISRTG